MSILYDEGKQAIAIEAKRVLEARVLPGKLLICPLQSGP